MEICFAESALLVRGTSWSTHLKGYSEKRSGREFEIETAIANANFTARLHLSSVGRRARNWRKSVRNRSVIESQRNLARRMRRPQAGYFSQVGLWLGGVRLALVIRGPVFHPYPRYVRRIPPRPTPGGAPLVSPESRNAQSRAERYDRK